MKIPPNRVRDKLFPSLPFPSSFKLSLPFAFVEFYLEWASPKEASFVGF
jgi:hypothetical protein